MVSENHTYLNIIIPCLQIIFNGHIIQIHVLCGMHLARIFLVKTHFTFLHIVILKIHSDFYEKYFFARLMPFLYRYCSPTPNNIVKGDSFLYYVFSCFQKQHHTNIPQRCVQNGKQLKEWLKYNFYI